MASTYCGRPFSVGSAPKLRRLATLAPVELLICLEKQQPEQLFAKQAQANQLDPLAQLQAKQAVFCRVDRCGAQQQPTVGAATFVASAAFLQQWLQGGLRSRMWRWGRGAQHLDEQGEGGACGGGSS